MFNLVWAREKDLLYIGSFHGGDLPEVFGVTGDHLATDAIGMHALSCWFRPLMRVALVNFVN